MSGMNQNAKLYKQAQFYSTVCGPYQCLTLPWWVQTPEPVYYPRHKCELKPLVCGEKVFGQIAKDIAAAKRSVDIITWGFDPGMVLERGTTAEDGLRYGELLKQLSERQSNPVTVRILVWHDDLATEHLMKNNPGYYGIQFPAIGCATSGYFSEAHQKYNAEWYEDVRNGRLKNICFRVRSVDVGDTASALIGESVPAKASAIGTALFATHHQKMLLIDYEDPVNAVGYVMGHNSITNYWDTSKHIFRDPRRETVYSKDPALASRSGINAPPTEQAFLAHYGKPAQPYQDVSVRVRGPILYDLNHNFCQAWQESVPPSSAFMGAYWLATRFLARSAYKVSREVQKRFFDSQPDGGFSARRKGKRPDSYSLANGCHSAQLMRTHPKHGEKTIKECYANLTRNLQHYIFIQNQYIQYEPWARHLKECVQRLRSRGYKKQIHVFILTSTPERDGMDLATYDVAKHLGQSERMKVEHEVAVAQAEKGKEAKPLTQEELSASGIEVVMGSLWTSSQREEANEYEEIYIHAKVAIVDDAAFTVGSANLNVRSMALDSELNILSEAKSVAFALRTELFAQCTGKTGPPPFDDMQPTIQRWRRIQKNNASAKDEGLPLSGQLLPFHVNRQPGMPVI